MNNLHENLQLLLQLIIPQMNFYITKYMRFILYRSVGVINYACRN